MLAVYLKIITKAMRHYRLRSIRLINCLQIMYRNIKEAGPYECCIRSTSTHYTTLQRTSCMIQ